MPKPRVLIADNNEGFLDELADFLKSEGYSVITAKDLDQAKKAIGRKYDAAILDIRLRSDKDDKDISGLMLAKTVPRGIPTIILTRYPTVGKVRQALAPRLKGIPAAFDFITKDELYDLLLPVLSDAIFVSDLQKGDSSAWKKLWSEEAPSVIALCRRHGLNRDDALRVCLKIFSESIRSPGYLLKRTALQKSLINKAILEMRRYLPNQRLEPKTASSSSQSDPTGEILVNEQLIADMTAAAVHGKIPPEELIKLLTQAIESLGPRQQKVMMLYTFQGASRSKIAKHLGIKEETVIKHLQDGSRKIRARIAALREE
ncbi:MAG TPA: sigma factor-like helix-turn-helix DNA-binding protein [Pyrinomonadaceae bacterium]|jgi:RNA polymerase sigma factor (sigma-70 family)|nr:sigma factor-like helix-turn-helix DNA-binding protein [Pyrinomonadaceae bacterium]